MSFRTRIPVRGGVEDHARVVYYPRFFHFFHCAFEDFFNETGRSYRQVLDEDRVGWPAVRAEADFREPLRFGDVLEVDMWCERVGEKSATFAYRGRRAGVEAVACSARITVACIDMDTFQGRPIPPAYRDLFARYDEPPSEGS